MSSFYWNQISSFPPVVTYEKATSAIGTFLKENYVENCLLEIKEWYLEFLLLLSIKLHNPDGENTTSK